jgi:DNA-binding transcriptional ArsR family regulator
MVKAKKIAIRIEFGEFADLFQALSDETRQRILVLLDEKERSVNDLVKEFNLSQPSISRHLSILKNAGLIQKQRKGQQVMYSIDPEKIGLCCCGFFGNFSCCDGLKIEKIEK